MWNKSSRKHSAVSGQRSAVRGQWSLVSSQQSADVTEIKPMVSCFIQKLKGKHSGVSRQPSAFS
ncbi:MAG: hypothetical protein F6J90_01390 [Moorea sp. SIOASIH]|nr:hypothetical protein [Moorena sp. SIOASIH]